ncbi:MAG: hypothetical protein ACE5HX_07510 [bacterium]
MNIFTKTTNLSKLVSSICNGDHKETELVEFVNLVQKISLSYLKYQEVIGKHIRWERNKHVGELEDLALDCVAGLFMRNDNKEFIQFKKYFCQNSTEIEQLDDVEILVLLRRLVIKKTKQELSRIFKERDPDGAKIVRNIKVAIKSSPEFDSFKEMGREYVFLKNRNGKTALKDLSKKNNGYHSNNGKNHTSNSDSNGKLNYTYLRKSLPSIPEKSLRGEYLNFYCPKDPVSAGIRKMLMVIKNDERYQNFIPLDMVARIMRHTNLEMARDSLVSQVNDFSPLDDLKLKEIEKRKLKVLIKIKKKIQCQYVKTNKISQEKGTIYYRALADILEDISQGKKYDSYFKHLRRYMPTLTQVAYRTQERTIFEYLGKLIKKWFRESLIELL